MDWGGGGGASEMKLWGQKKGKIVQEGLSLDRGSRAGRVVEVSGGLVWGQHGAECGQRYQDVGVSEGRKMSPCVLF